MSDDPILLVTSAEKDLSILIYGLYRIATVPPGDYPLEMREKWKGLLLPCSFIEEVLYSEDGGGEQILYHTPQIIAFRILEMKHPGQLQKWKAYGFPEEPSEDSNSTFAFPEEFVEQLSIAEAKLRYLDDMEILDEILSNPPFHVHIPLMEEFRPSIN